MSAERPLIDVVREGVEIERIAAVMDEQRTIMVRILALQRAHPLAALALVDLAEWINARAGARVVVLEELMAAIKKANGS